MNRITASGARYIKLGPGGAWEPLCFNDGTLRLAYNDVPHDVALSGDLDRLKHHFAEPGKPPRVASQHAQQVWDFYHAPEDTLWITFANGLLYWCQASRPVEYLGFSNEDQLTQFGSRLRRVIGQWQCTDIAGNALRMVELSGGLTKTAAYQQTICKIEVLDYLLRKINAEPDRDVAAVVDARAHLLACLQKLVARLTPQDFELLVDLIFQRSGWQRVGQVGGPQKTVDLELMLPATGETAFVQVKSQTNQRQLNDYATRFAAYADARMFYAYHTGPDTLAADDPRVYLVGPDRIAQLALDNGLTDWITGKAA